MKVSSILFFLVWIVACNEQAINLEDKGIDKGKSADSGFPVNNNFNLIDFIKIESSPSGFGSEITTVNVFVGETLNLFVIGRNFGDPFLVTNPPADWVITGTTTNLTSYPSPRGSSAFLEAISAGSETLTATYDGNVETITVNTVLAPVPPEPASFSVGTATNSTLELYWSSGGGSTNNYTIAYDVGATPPADCSSGTVIPAANISGTTHQVSGLSGGTLYSFRLCAGNANPTPDYSAGVVVSGSTLSGSLPEPTSLIASSLGQTSIGLSWSSGGGDTTDFRISYQAGSSAPADCSSGTTIGEASIDGTSHLISGLTINTEYSFRLCSINSNFPVDVSSGVTLSASTQLEAPPGEIANLSISALSPVSAYITWDLPSDLSNVSGYRISYVTGATAPADCQAGTSTFIDFANRSGTLSSVLSNNTEYSFRVCSVSSNGLADSVGLTATITTLIENAPTFICDSGDVSTTCTVNTSKLIPNNEVIRITGNLVLNSGANLRTNSTERAVISALGDITLNNNAYISGNFELRADNVVINTGGVVRADDLGFGSAAGPCAAASSVDFGGGGGCHGGVGGDSSGGALGGTAIYGSMTEPIDFGSGGGVADGAGGAGGGAIQILAATSVLVDGTISSTGQYIGHSGSDGSGGGAGGSIWIQTQTLSGNGAMTVKGGNGRNLSDDGGGGSGGRISLDSSVAHNYVGTVRYEGGWGPDGAESGATGTYYLNAPNLSSVLCSTGDILGASCTINSDVTIPSNMDSFTTVGDLILDNGAILRMEKDAIAENVLNVGGDLIVNNGAQISIPNGLSSITANNITYSGSLTGRSLEKIAINVTSDFTITASGNLLINADITTDTFTVQSGGVLRADGLGFDSALGPCAGSSNVDLGGGGGCYGGFGGDSSRGILGGTATYGSMVEPVDFGSGGGVADGAGGAGGGAIKIAASTSVVVDGSITSKGLYVGHSGSDGSGGGSGGSIWIQTGTLSGAGEFSVVGGNGRDLTDEGGGGSGGRISLNSSVSHDYIGTVTFRGGNGPNAAANGLNGTYYMDAPNFNSALCSVGDITGASCTISYDIAIPTNMASFTTVGDLIIDTGAILRIEEDYVNNNVLNVGGDLIVGSGAEIKIPNGLTSITATNINYSGILNGRSLEKIDINVTSDFTIGATGNLFINGDISADTFNIAAGGILRADGLGHSSTSGPCAGNPDTNLGGGGGCYGGFGGNSSGGTLGGTATYGSLSAPVDFGSGGGYADGSGGAGGGAIQIITTTSVVVDGSISAKGYKVNHSGSDGSGGGSGGSVWIQTGTLSGSGAFSVVGGDGENLSDHGGGGSGGRISLDSSVSHDYIGTVTFRGGYGPGAADSGLNGTYYLGAPNFNSALCSAGDITGASCTISYDIAIPTNMASFTTAGDLVLDSGSILRMEKDAIADNVLNVGGDLIVGSGAEIKIPNGLTSITATNINYSGILNGRSLEKIDINVTSDFTIGATGNLFINGDISADTFNIAAGGILRADGLGHSSTSGPCAGNPDTNLGGGGGCYGGFGGNSSGGTLGGTATYGSLTAPVDFGSGGGYADGSGGAGGGAIQIITTTSVVVDGSISAKGYKVNHSGSDGSGGGSGGSVWIQTGTLSGSGAFSVVGGDGENLSDHGGGGSGGRISLDSSVSHDYIGTVTFRGGYGPGAADSGLNGTYYLGAPNFNSALCSAGDITGASCTISYDIAIPTNMASFTTAGDLVLDSGSILRMEKDAIADNVLNVGGDLIVGSGAEIKIPNGLTSITATNINYSGILNGRSLEKIDIDVTADFTIGATGNLFINGDISADTFNIAAGGILRADGLGHSSTSGPCAGNPDTNLGGGGGCYGGFGGNSSGGTLGGTATYGSLSAPVDFGSGGGYADGSGGAGGGAIQIITTTSVVVDGSISAKGYKVNHSGSDGSGGGSGGSVWIQTGTLSGSGAFSVVGGDGENLSDHGGGGSGGRISLDSSVSHDFIGTVIFRGGYGPGAADSGLNGTYYLGAPNFNSALCSAGDITGASCTISYDIAIPTNMASFTTAGDLVLDSGSILRMEKDAIADNVLNVGGDLIVGSGAEIKIPNGLTSITATNINYSGILNGRSLEKIDIDVTADFTIGATGNLFINGDISADTFNIAAGGILRADGLGHGSTSGPCAGSSNTNLGGGGGCYGGFGGNSSGGTLGGTATYGSLTAPVDFGSGGGYADGSGGAGGGAIQIITTTSVVVDGSISAKGYKVNHSGSDGSGGGSGGSVWIQTGTLSGSGAFSVVGGDGENLSDHGGGGSGGRISLDVPSANDFYVGTVVADGGFGPGSAADGAAGTIYLAP